MKKRVIVLSILLIIGYGLAAFGLVQSQSPAIIELDADGSWDWVVTLTPYVITSEPLPTYTPLATYTPWVITATSEDTEPTPTDEVFTPVPSDTPTPTVTPTPPNYCLMQNTSGSTIRVRVSPSTSAAQLGGIGPGEYTYPEAYYEGGGFRWYKIWWDETQYGWTANFYTIIDGCTNIPYENPFPLTREVFDGVHLLAGDGASSIAPFAFSINSAKCTDGIYNLCLQLKQINPSMKIIARTYTHDCVPQNVLFDATQWWDQIKYILPNGFDYYEIENECAPPDALYGQWGLFSIEMAKLVQRDKNGALLAFSFGPGWPQYDLWKQLIPYIQWVAAHPLPDGRYHGMALHAAPYASFTRSDMPWVNSAHIADRMTYIRLTILGAGGPDLKTWPGEIWITEVGLSDGYSGNWDAVYNCNEVKDAYHTTDAQYKIEGMIDGFSWWNFGKVGRWTSDHACSSTIWG
jgi:hypothetical protein